jgi:hypothetical protein
VILTKPVYQRLCIGRGAPELAAISVSLLFRLATYPFVGEILIRRYEPVVPPATVESTPQWAAPYSSVPL